MDKKKEEREWRKIQGFDMDYEVSSHGEIKRMKQEHLQRNRFGEPVMVKYPEQEFKLQTHYKGYKTTRLTKMVNGKRKPMKFFVHRLVAIAFIPPAEREDQVQINHINGIKDDNHYSNLEWMSDAENRRHASETGITHVFTRGEKHPKSKRVISTDMNTGVEVTYGSMSEAARVTGTGQGHISQVCRKLLPNAHGRLWRYKE